MTEPNKSDKREKYRNAWEEARELVWHHRRRLALGLALMLISRLAGMVLPASSKYLIDEVIGKGRRELLMPLALGVAAATIVDAASSFALSQVLEIGRASCRERV